MVWISKRTLSYHIVCRKPSNRIDFSDFNHLFRRQIWQQIGRYFGKKRLSTHFESLLAAGQQEAKTEFKRFTRSISFGLFMVCVGLVVTMAYLLWA